MKILVVNERLSYSSSSFYSLDLAEALTQCGDDVRLCTKGGELRDLFRQRGVATYTAKFNLFSYHKLIGFLREFAPDLIHVQDVESVDLGRRLSTKLDVPHVLTVHRAPARANCGLSHPLLAGVLASSESVRAALVNDQAISKGLIRVIKPGVNVEAFRPRPALASSPAGHGVPVIGAVGRLIAVKGHDVLLRAARLALDDGIDAMFMIVGEGPQERSLRALVEELDLLERVTFLPHMPSRRELYRLFDIIVVPTLRGGVGATALEAMATGKPVVVTALGEMLAMIRHGENGLITDEKDPRGLAEAIVKLVRNPDLSAELGRAARATAVEDFPLSKLVAATRDFYEDVQAQLHESALEN